MKFTLTISEASIDDLVHILTSPGTPSALRNSAAAAITGNAGGNGDDDETGDTPAATGTVDANGIPWDDRIHSTPAKLTSKNVWRAKRGVDTATVNAVEAELRARGPAPVQQPQYIPPQQMQQPVQIDPTFQPLASVVIPPQQPQYQQPAPMFDAGTAGHPQPVQQYQQPAPVQQQQPAPQAAPAAGAIDFMNFMGHVATISQNGLADANYFGGLAQRVSQAFGAPLPGGITEFQKDQRMVDYAIQIMVSENRWM